jgi:hypothetical protein
VPAGRRGRAGASTLQQDLTAKLPSGVDLTVTYNTTPSNETHAQNAKVGEFVTPRRPTLELSASSRAPWLRFRPANRRSASSNADGDWTMALYPGALARGAVADAGKLIKLEAMFEKGKARRNTCSSTSRRATASSTAMPS